MQHLQGKVVGVGFHKTGTSTLREALKILGYRVADNKPGLLIPILEGRYQKVMKKLKAYQACEDLPWNRLYPVIDQYYPGSKFILTTRDEEAWYASVTRHIGDLRSPMHEWLYGRGKGVPQEDKAHALQVYRDHNEAVRKYFENRPADLLEIDFSSGDGWEQLCEFLGLEIPEVPLPHYNNSDSRPSRQKNRLQKTIKRGRKHLKCYIKNRYIDWRGLW
jgi:hypothetical protein